MATKKAALSKDELEVKSVAIPVYKPGKVPKSLAVAADQLYQLRNDRLALAKVVEAMEKQEKALKNYLIENLPKSQASGVAGKLARATIKVEEVPQLKEHNKFFAYVKKHDRFDLMQRSLNKSAVMELIEQGKKVPGIELFPVVKVSLNKA